MGKTKPRLSFERRAKPALLEIHALNYALTKLAALAQSRQGKTGETVPGVDPEIVKSHTEEVHRLICDLLEIDYDITVKLKGE